MAVAGVIADMPMHYWQEPSLALEHPSVAAYPAPDDSGLGCLAGKLEGIPLDSPVVVVTSATEVERVRGLLRDAAGPDPSADRLHVLAHPTGAAFDRHSGDFARDEDGSLLRPAEGSFGAFAALFDSGLASRLVLQGHRYAMFSFMENTGARISPAILGKFASDGSAVCAEITDWQVDPGPLALRLREGGPALLEPEQIDPDILRGLRDRPDLVGGIATNTYWVDLQAVFRMLGEEPTDAPGEPAPGLFRLRLDSKIKPVVLAKEYAGRTVLCHDARLSAVTAFLKTLHMPVAASRYLKLPG